MHWTLGRYSAVARRGLQFPERLDCRLATTGVDDCTLDPVCDNVSLLSVVDQREIGTNASLQSLL